MNFHVKVPTPFSTVGKEVAGNGYHPVPIKPGSKSPGAMSWGRWHPMFAWQRFRDRPPSPIEINVWSGWEGSGVGVILGNEVVEGWEVGALDFDTDDHMMLEIMGSAVPESPVQKRGRRGYTAFYLFPSGTEGKRFERGGKTVCEILTGNGTRQTVIPPSIHPDTGQPYEWVTKRTLLDTPASGLPRVDEEMLERFVDTVQQLEGVAADKRPRIDPGEGSAESGNSFGSAVKTAALRNLGMWVPQLRLYRCQATAQGFEAVPTWRASGSGKPLRDRKLNLKIHPLGIRDFGSGEGFNAIGLVMKAMGMEFLEAYSWLEAQLGLTPEPWGDFPLGKVSEPVVGSEPIALMMTADEARAAVAYAVAAHLEEGTGVRAIRVATGIGKTSIAVQKISDEVRRLRTTRSKASVVFAVPTHRLGEAIVKQFAEQGVTAKLFRGRNANNPDGGKMCADLEAVTTALELGANVATSCCLGKNPKTGTLVRCRFYDECAYQRQTDDKPDVWIIAHQLLFVASSAMGTVASVFIDESFWQKGIWAGKGGMTLDEIGAAPMLRSAWLDDAAVDVAEARRKLALGLKRQPELGGVARKHLAAEGLTSEECLIAAHGEWGLAEPIAVWPGMPLGERRKAAKIAAGMRFIRARARIWTAARALLANEDEAAVSGRLYLDEDRSNKNGRLRIARTRGVKPIAAQWDAQTMIMDATLPNETILKVFYPEVQIVADISAEMPHARILQVVAAPVSTNKLMKSEAERNLQSIRRTVISRFVQLGRKPTLVVAQKAVAEWLTEAGLPEGIAVEHFNAMAGLDCYKDVRLLIAIGRTMPSVLDVEGLSGAMTGAESLKTAEPCEAGRSRWYPKPARAIQLKDGRSYQLSIEQHPDATAEAARWQVCEAEIVQAIGRARGVNRTSANPVAIEVWADVILPIAVDDVRKWVDAVVGAESEMANEGIKLDSPSDMTLIWPSVWATAEAARRWQSRSTSGQNLIRQYSYREMPACEFRYKHPGARQKWRTGSYEPQIVGDPQRWLEERLGIKLAAFELLGLPARISKGEVPSRYVLQEVPTPFPTRTVGIGWLALIDFSRPSLKFLDPKVFEPSRQAVHVMQ